MQLRAAIHLPDMEVSHQLSFLSDLELLRNDIFFIARSHVIVGGLVGKLLLLNWGFSVSLVDKS